MTTELTATECVKNVKLKLFGDDCATRTALVNMYMEFATVESMVMVIVSKDITVRKTFMVLIAAKNVTVRVHRYQQMVCLILMAFQQL